MADVNLALSVIILNVNGRITADFSSKKCKKDSEAIFLKVLREKKAANLNSKTEMSFKRVSKIKTFLDTLS